MNVDTLRYFIEVANCRSISKAAENLYITQPALSRHLQRLEKELNVQLFLRERGKLSCEITEAGSRCLQDARQIVAHADHLRSVTQAYLIGEEGRLNFGYCGSEGNWLYELLRELRKRYPHIELVMCKLDNGELARQLAVGELDVALLISGFDYPMVERLQFHKLFPSRLQILVAQSHPLAQRTNIRIGELREERWIMYSERISPTTYQAFFRLCEYHGFQPEVAAVYDTSVMVNSDIQAGLGIGIYNNLSVGMAPEKFAVIDVITDEDDPWPDGYTSLAHLIDNCNPCLHNIIREAEQFFHVWPGTPS